jgi:hypothetical protein
MFGVFGVEMQGMLVHGQQGEPGVIGFGDGPAGAMFIDIANLEILVIAAKGLLIAVFPGLDHAVLHLELSLK